MKLYYKYPPEYPWSMRAGGYCSGGLSIIGGGNFPECRISIYEVRRLLITAEIRYRKCREINASHRLIMYKECVLCMQHNTNES